MADKKVQAKNPTGGLKKRQQIENASRSMFIWVAIASVAVSICIVSAQFLFQKWTYNNHVLDAKYKAAEQLKKNITSAKQLQDAVNALVSNDDLASVKKNTDDSNTQSVLDALPSRFDSTALATSFQQAILSHSGVTIEGISVPSDQDPSAGTTGAAAIANSTGKTPVNTSAATPQEMRFTLTVSGSYDKIRSMLLDLERTIRPMKLTAIDLSGDDANMTATIGGMTYYQPSKSANIKQEVVK
jgi:hypothetical protein